jgi:YjgF/chorismate_mutase-like, putative endoribonuclease
MNMGRKEKILNDDNSRLVTAEQRLTQLGIKLPAPPEPFGIYAEAVQTGSMVFLTGMLPTVGREAKFIGRIGAELDVKTGHMAAYLAAVNALAVARQNLGSLDKVTRIAFKGPLKKRLRPFLPTTHSNVRRESVFEEQELTPCSQGAGDPLNGVCNTEG